MLLDHRRLTVYRVALESLAIIDEVAEQLPPGRSHLKDQLGRAATSVVLNIAEGAGEFSPRDKARFYRKGNGKGKVTGPSLSAGRPW
jgi:four helix bundle protein